MKKARPMPTIAQRRAQREWALRQQQKQEQQDGNKEPK